MIDTIEELHKWMEDNPVPPGGIELYETWRDTVKEIFGRRHESMLIETLINGDDTQQYNAIVLWRVGLGCDGYKVGVGGAAYWDITKETGDKLIIHPRRK